MNRGRNFVDYALTVGALELLPNGRILKSGRVSPYFFNSAVFSTGELLSELAIAYASAIAGAEDTQDKVVIFGPAYKGIPLAAAIAIALWDYHGIQAAYAFNRKEVKDHAEGGIVVGHSLQGMNVLIVDDVITTGGSCGEAVDIILKHGGRPVGCAIAFDRQETGVDGGISAVQEFEKMYGIPVRAVATLEDFIGALEEDNGDVYPPEILSKILEYREQYGVRSQ